MYVEPDPTPPHGTERPGMELRHPKRLAAVLVAWVAVVALVVWLVVS